MLRTLALLTGLMVVPALGGEVSGTDTEPEDPPFCCLPDQWQTKQVHTYLNVFRGNYEFGKVESHMVYDAVKERVAYITTRTDNLGSEEQFNYYLMYKDNLMYVYNPGTGTCIKQALDGPFIKRCVPGSATIEDPEFTYGAGSSTIKASRVKFYLTRKAGNYLFVTLTVSPECIPIVEKFTIFPFGASGMDTETAEFTNFTVGRVPNSVFDLPPGCCKAAFGTPEREAMMKTHTILTGLMVILATWSSGVNGQASQQKPPLCCIPDQWTVKQTISYLKINRGNFEYGEVLSNWTYDSINQREIYVTTRFDNLGRQQQLVYYLLFQENMMYVYNNQTDMCIKQTLNRPFYRRCIPASATVEDSGAIFGTGAETINATRVKFQYPMRHGGSLHVSLTVSQDCIPLVETFTVYPWGAGGMDMETIESTDMNIHSVPDSLFEHPRACCNARFARPEHYPSISFDF